MTNWESSVRVERFNRLTRTVILEVATTETQSRALCTMTRSQNMPRSVSMPITQPIR